ncbi:MAG TPA: hypothetical protein VH301_12210, partial [Usitatibacter sp.]|nr:hypothetical protein [Usitatibacter sp.]
MRRALLLFFILASFPSLAAPANDAIAALGKQKAAASSAKWEVRDLVHPVMGSIKVAIWLTAQSTDAGRDRIVSSVYFSCQKAKDSIAIELANAPLKDPAGGVGPKELPRLTCVGVKPDGTPQRSDIAADWEIDDFGDVLTRGLSPGMLRRCASIAIDQEVALPPGWPRESQRIAIELSPYAPELDEIFAQCGEEPVYAAATPPAPAAAKPASKLSAAAKPSPAPKGHAPPISQNADWRRARTISKGNTNIRSSGGLEGQVVTQLPPGMPMLVQPANG